MNPNPNPNPNPDPNPNPNPNPDPNPNPNQVPDGYTAVGMPARLIAPKGAKGESTRSQLDLGRAK